METENHNYKVVLRYDGTAFQGWQSQPDGRTVQQTVEQALADIFGADIRVYASGRTDTGVHAHGQVINFYLSRRIAPDELIEKLNYRLPEDVRVITAEEVPAGFHARHSAVGKIYIYTILRKKRPRFRPRTDVFYWGGPLDIDAMRRAARCLEGTQDFSSFGCNPGYAVGEKVRTISKLDIHEEGDYIRVEVKGSGFLYKMVRSIVGTLIWVGTGRIRPEEMQDILDARDRTKAGPAADPSGLCLAEVYYSE
jgi:tRNA pseudouridine38-40 synthase